MKLTGNYLILTLIMAGLFSVPPPSYPGKQDLGRKANLLILTIETLRSDHVGAYGNRLGLTPNLDAFASQGVLIDEMITPIPRTNPALASIFTGLYPLNNGVRNLYIPLAEKITSLTKTLKKHGYATGAIIAHPNLTGRTGLDSGFDYYEAEWGVSKSAEETTNSVLNWIKKNKGKPYFIWAHYMDPHWTYQPPRKYEKKFSAPLEGDFSLWSDLAEGKIKHGDIYFKNSMSKKVREHVRSLYRGEIAYADEQIGRLLRELEGMKADEKLLVVILADHGESLGEHDYYFEHGAYTYEESIRIPCLLRFPSRHPYSKFAGKRLEGLSANIDLLPTILDFLDIPFPGKVDGRSLLPAILGGKRKKPRLVFGESGKKMFNQNPRRFLDGIKGKWYFVRDDRYKLIYIPKKGGGIWEFYDLTSDPGEMKNIYNPADSEVKRLKPELENWMKKSAFAPPEEEIFYQIKPHLRSLGYMD